MRFVCFRPEILPLGKFGPKIRNCQFKLKFGTSTNSNMQNSVVEFTLYFLSEIPFLGKFGQKFQNCQFKLKFGTSTDSNMQNSVVLFIFSVFDWKYPLWVNLAQKIKVVSLSLNLVPRRIRICRIQRWCSLSLFSTRNTPFGQIWSKK